MDKAANELRGRNASRCCSRAAHLRGARTASQAVALRPDNAMCTLWRSDRVLAACTYVMLNQIPDSIDHSHRHTRIFSYQVAKRSPLRARRLNVNTGHEYATLVRVDDCFYQRFIGNRICSLHKYYVLVPTYLYEL